MSTKKEYTCIIYISIVKSLKCVEFSCVEFPCVEFFFVEFSVNLSEKTKIRFSAREFSYHFFLYQYLPIATDAS